MIVPRIPAREAEKIIGHRLDRRRDYWFCGGEVCVHSWTREGPPFGYRTKTYRPVPIEPFDATKLKEWLATVKTGISWNDHIKVGDTVEAPGLIDGAVVVAVFRDTLGSRYIAIEEPDRAVHVCKPWDVCIVIPA
jgi:hypothetical protein